MIFHNFAFKTIDMDNSKYFDKVPEIDKAIADHQNHKVLTRNEITLEECSRYQQAGVLMPVINIDNGGSH
jgi:hypothetical protein